MKKLDRADFTDLDWIPFAIGALALLALRVAAIGDVRALLHPRGPHPVLRLLLGWTLHLQAMVLRS
jgi:hypothetical protein